MSELVEMMERAGSVSFNTMASLDEFGWSEDFQLQEAKDKYKKMKEQVKDKVNELGGILNLGERELQALGFKRWSDGSELMLIPLWALDMIPDGTELKDIFGGTSIKGQDVIDTDIRFGCIPYGIRVPYKVAKGDE